MKETITIQVGQCGNQIGNYFWNLLLKEQQLLDDTKDMPEAFFHYTSNRELKARALLIDMECVSDLIWVLIPCIFIYVLLCFAAVFKLCFRVPCKKLWRAQSDTFLMRPNLYWMSTVAGIISLQVLNDMFCKCEWINTCLIFSLVIWYDYYYYNYNYNYE